MYNTSGVICLLTLLFLLYLFLLDFLYTCNPLHSYKVANLGHHEVIEEAKDAAADIAKAPVVEDVYKRQGVIFTLYPVFFSMFESNDIDSLVSGALGYFYFRKMLSL